MFEIDPADDARVQLDDPDRYPIITIVFRLDHARLAIQMRVNGASKDEIEAALRTAPRPGTGRNHPDNVARRHGRRTT